MRKNLQNLALILTITFTWFSSAYFAAAALSPALALAAALIATIAALVVFNLLEMDYDTAQGLPFGLLLTLPFICIFVGVIWWIAHLVGLW